MHKSPAKNKTVNFYETHCKIANDILYNNNNNNGSLSVVWRTKQKYKWYNDRNTQIQRIIINNFSGLI
jgi:hypothetical protein